MTNLWAVSMTECWALIDAHFVHITTGERTLSPMRSCSMRITSGCALPSLRAVTCAEPGKQPQFEVQPASPVRTALSSSQAFLLFRGAADLWLQLLAVVTCAVAFVLGIFARCGGTYTLRRTQLCCWLWWNCCCQCCCRLSMRQVLCRSRWQAGRRLHPLHMPPARKGEFSQNCASLTAACLLR